MKGKMPLLVLLIIIFVNQSCKQELTTVGFYNIENLFDTLDNPHTNDNEFLPGSEKDWNTEKYTNKLDSLAKIIALIGDKNGPEILGLCEMENKAVLEDLVTRPIIADLKYEIAHLESNDYRGIDVALFYKPEFTLDTLRAISVSLDSQPRFRTRDILHVQLSHKKLGLTHFFINHWPSRIGGSDKTEYKRMAASNALKNELQLILESDPEAQVIIMGDFNDEPVNNSLKNIEETGFVNVLAGLDSAGRGTYCYRGDWNMLDQILLSPSLLDRKGVTYVDDSANILELDWMKQKGEDNRYAGYPLRTWGGRLYLGGFSDHFPVYIFLKN
jgi:hypothetical protein